MRKLLIAALLSSHLLGSGPAFAQGYAPVRETGTGAFGGVRVRVPFGGGPREPVRAGLAFAVVAPHNPIRPSPTSGQPTAIGIIAEALWKVVEHDHSAATQPREHF